MASAQEYAQWIVDNKDKQGSAEFETVAKAYQLAKEKLTSDRGFGDVMNEISFEDWKQKSLLAPAIQNMAAVTPFGILRPDVARQQMLSAGENIAGKVSGMAQGLAEVAQHPIESAKRAYTSITENPGAAAGEIVKGAIYDPELFMTPGNITRAGKVVDAVAPTVGGTVMAPINVVKGAARGVAYPQGTGKNSALLPISPTHVPHSEAEAFMKMTPEQRVANVGNLSQVPTAPLYESSPVSNWAYGMAPTNAQGLKLVPAKGHFWEGVGETLGSGIRTNPLQGLADLGGIVGGIGPVGTAIKSIPTVASGLLQKATQFERGFGPAREAAEAAAAKINPTPVAPVVPQNYPLTVQGPGQTLPPTVMPMGTAPRSVNIEGQSSTLPHQIDTSNSQSARPQPIKPTATPAEVSQQVAASKIQQPSGTVQPIAPEGTPALPEQRWTPEEQLKVKQAMEKPQPASQPQVQTPPMGALPTADVSEITAKVPTPTKQQFKEAAKAEEKLAAKGQTKPSRYTPEEQKQLTNQATKEADEFVKSHKLDTLTLDQKDQIKVNAINKQKPITAALSNDKILNVLSKEESAKLKIEGFKLEKLIAAIQNESVKLSGLKTTLKNWEAIYDRKTAKGQVPWTGAEGTKLITPEVLQDIRDQITHIERNEPKK